MPQRKQPTPGEIVTLASAAFILLAAFLPFYEVSSPLGSTSWNAWSDAFLIFPLVLIVVLMSVAIGVLTALRAFGVATLPPRLLGFTLDQLNVAVSLLGFATLLTYFLRNSTPDKGAGLIIMFLASIGMVVGEILLRAFAPDIRLPPVLGFAWAQIHLLLGVWAAVMMLSFAVGNVVVSPLTLSKGTGFWLMLVGAIALAVGAIVQLGRRAHLQ